MLLNRHGTFLDKNFIIPEKIKNFIDSFTIPLSHNIQEENNVKFTISQQEIDWMKCHDESKWNDYLFYRYRFKMYPKFKILTPFPVHLLIEPTSVCNLRCIMCFQSDNSFTIPKYMGFMSLELAKNLIDQMKQHNCGALTMAARGEPTLSKYLGDILKYAKDSKIIDIKLNTNALFMTEKMCHDILSAEVSELVFSVDGDNKKTYEEIRKRGNFEKVLEGINRFHDIRNKHYSKSTTITRISAVIFREDQNIEEMKSFWNGKVDEVAVKRESPCRDSYHNNFTDVTEPCSFLWERMYVWYDGTVNPCFFDYKSLLSPGNAYKNSLSEIWLGENYQKLREDHLQKMRNKRIPCDRCPIF